jgi:hypothetical protein
MHKKCRVCNKIKSIDEFHKKKNTLDGHRNECKECVKNIQKKYKESPGFKEKRKEYDKERYENNRDKILERKKEYHEENREKILSYKKVYREENKDKIKKWRSENMFRYSEGQARYREKYPHIIAWRSILYSTLDRLGTEKQGHTIDMLGYSALELKYHIENQFQPGMNWKNYGDWHIDHIKGVINFDPLTDVKIVCALENLRPLWATTREIDGIIYEGNLNRPKFYE